MACRVHVAALPEVRINETDYDVIKFVALRLGGAAEAAPIGHQEIASGVGKSVSAVRRSCHALEREGLMHIQPRRLSNGGRIENAYGITRKGYVTIASTVYGRSPNPDGLRLLHYLMKDL